MRTIAVLITNCLCCSFALTVNGGFKEKDIIGTLFFLTLTVVWIYLMGSQKKENE